MVTVPPNRRIQEDQTLPGKEFSDWLLGSANQDEKLTFGISGINTKKQWKIEQKPSTKRISIIEKVENICLAFVSVEGVDS